MDPWMSSTWKRNWIPHYPPNRVKKEKLTKSRREKTHKHISLHKTAERQQLKNHRCWSRRPNRRQNLPANHPSVKQCQMNKVRYRNTPRMEKPPKRTFKEMSPAGSWSVLVIVANSGNKTDTADEFQFDTLSPQSPPDHERGHQPLEYVPKSPVYPPPDDSLEESSVPDLETPREHMTPDPEKLKKSDNVNNMEVPADVNADKDHFQDIDRQNTLRQ